MTRQTPSIITRTGPPSIREVWARRGLGQPLCISITKCLCLISSCPFRSPSPAYFYLSKMCSNIPSRPVGDRKGL